jgi:hypothetical protein
MRSAPVVCGGRHRRCARQRHPRGNRTPSHQEPAAAQASRDRSSAIAVAIPRLLVVVVFDDVVVLVFVLVTVVVVVVESLG